MKHLIYYVFAFFSLIAFTPDLVAQCPSDCSSNNTLLGIDAGISITTGYANTFIGRKAGRADTSGRENTFIGRESGKDNTSGNENTFVGRGSGKLNDTGDENVFIGSSSGRLNTNGKRNSYLGVSAGSFINGDKNICIGSWAGPQGLWTQPNVTNFMSNKLFIDVENNNTPLIYGEFDNNFIRINGDLGVGLDTIAPVEKLDVDGAIKIGTTNKNNDGTIRYNGTHFQGRHNGVWKDLDEEGSLWSPNGTTAYYNSGKVGIGTITPNAQLHIKTLSGQNGMNIDIGTQRAMHVSGNRGVTIGNTSAPPAQGLAVTGSAGIGTNSPAQKLEVNGAIKLGTTTSNINGSIRYDGTNFQGHTGGSWVNLNGTGGAGGSVWSQSGSEAFYNSGNVGIGTNNPAHLLHVEGDVAVAGSVIAPSDRRLKQDIQPITEALALLSQLTPKTYTYKAEYVTAHGLSDKKQYGLIAQELAAVLPDLIADKAIVDEDGTSYKGIEYAQLIPILTQAIKELSVENKTLKIEQEKSKEITSSILARLAKLETKSTQIVDTDN